ncbi:MAG TPA: thioredoxin-dependent thiol peroxidase [Bacteroidetes bacterium]|nr:thioredoxin-dependent thiol peroxidase [Bacteroidota bacterium]|tara:strand:- start:396 stop:863 length:468 start_codon:yes stop_codon:yes gene_type:complete
MSHLNTGDSAPLFESIDQNGNPLRLQDFKGKKVILYFYPKDDTPGCTAESCNFRDNYAMLLDKGYAVLGASIQGEASHQKFIGKYDLPFPLIADTDKSVHEAYGTWGIKKMYGKEYYGTIRTTFVIDAEGKIEHVIRKVKNKEATEQVLKLTEAS